MASDCVINMVGAHAGGRYDGLMKAVWQQAAVTSCPPPAAVGLTLNADRLTLLASAPKAKAPSAIPYLSQARPPHTSMQLACNKRTSKGWWAQSSADVCAWFGQSKLGRSLPMLQLTFGHWVVVLPSGLWVC